MGMTLGLSPFFFGRAPPSVGSLPSLGSAEISR